MPNKRFGLRGFNVTRTDAEKRPDPITPVMESVAGVNQTWRGIEDHGVQPEYDPSDPITPYVDINGRNTEIHYEEEPKIQDAVPVYLVQDSPRELRQFWTDRVTLNAVGTQIVGKDEQRVTTKVVNTDAVKTVWIASSREDLWQRGYPLTPGQNIVITGEVPVYAVASDGSGVVVGLYVETVVPERVRG